MRAPFVILSGLPGSGKSTLGQALSQALSLPLLDKDQFLEELFEEEQSPICSEKRNRLSRLADQRLREEVLRAQGAVVVSWWKHPNSAEASGTSTDWLGALRGPVVEVHCQCHPALAVKRFVARERHPGHCDSRWKSEDLLTFCRDQEVLGPLKLGRVLVVPCEGEPETNALVAQIFDT